VSDLYINGLLKYIGKMDYNTPNRNQPDAHSLFNLGAHYKKALATNPLILRLNVDNMTDKRYCRPPAVNRKGWASSLSRLC